MKIQLPEKLKVLFVPARYKVLHGGRGGAKSWGAIQAAIVRSASEKIRILCCREIQNSIKESSHRLIKEQIERLGMTAQFTITDRSIACNITGSEFIFEGLFRNVNRIKSLEGIDLCIVEEAEKVSDESWEILTPTIRKENSEIWVLFNPQYEEDPTYKRFVANPPDGAIVVQINYMDNPWFPEVLRQEMEQDKARDQSLYEWKWLGKPKGSGRRIWTAFDKLIHVRDVPLVEIAKSATCYMAMDPHSHYYPFCTWIAVLPKNERGKWPEDFYKHVYAEWPTYNDLNGFYHEMRHKLLFKDSMADMAREIQAHDGIEYGIKVSARFIDTRFAKGAGGWNAVTNTDGVVAQFAKKENGGLLFQMPKEARMSAQRQVIHSDMLFNRNVPRGPFNEPAFSVSPSCRNVIASMLNHRLEEDSEKEDEKFKEASDTLRIGYAGFEDLGWKDPNRLPSGTSSFAHQFNRTLGL